MIKGVCGWLALVIILIASIPRGSVFASEIVVGYYEDARPYSFEENGKVKGIFPEVIDEAAKILGMTIKYSKLPPQRASEYIKKGEIDAIIPIFKKEGEKIYNDVFFPSLGIAPAEISFFCRENSNIKYTGNFQDLKSYAIGCVKDYQYGEKFKNAAYLQKDFSSLSDEQMLEKLINGRFQVGVGSEPTIRYYARKRGYENKIKFLSPPFFRRVLYIGFSKALKHKVLATQFSDALDKLGKKEIHQAILRKYGMGDDVFFLKELVIGCDKENHSPYSFWEKGKLKGVYPDVLKQVADNIGVKIRFSPISISELPALIQSGKIDGITSIPRNFNRYYIYYVDQSLGISKFGEKGYDRLAALFGDGFDEFKNTQDYLEILKQYKAMPPLVRIAVEERPPYQGQYLPGYGPVAEIVSQAFIQAGYRLEFRFMTRKNLLDAVRNGSVDAGFSMEYSPEKEKDYLYSEPLAISSPIVFCKRKDNTIIYSILDDLKPYCIGIVRGYSYDQAFMTLKGLQLIEADQAERNIENVLSGNIDLAVIDKLHGEFLLDRMPENQKKKLELMKLDPKQKEVRKNLRLILPRENPKSERIRKEFNETLKQLIRSGTVGRILKQHGVPDEILPK